MNESTPARQNGGPAVNESTKQAILILSYGTVSRAAYDCGIGKLAADLRAESNCPVLEAICGKAAINRCPEMAFDYVISRLTGEHIRELLIVPTFLTDGPFFREVCGKIEKYDKTNGGSLSIRFLSPLLERKDLVKQMPLLLDKVLGLTGIPFALLIGHGSGTPADHSYQELQENFRKAGFFNVRIALLHGDPSPEAVTADLPEKSKVHVIPLLMTAGKHASRDVAGDDNSAASRLRARGLLVTVRNSGLCEYESFRREAFAEILSSRLQT